MTGQIEFSLEETANKGRYVAKIAGHDEVGELTFSRVSADSVIADHTGVPEALRGRGIGQALVERLIADARERGFRIVPLCPFVKAQFERNPEWADVWQK